MRVSVRRAAGRAACAAVLAAAAPLAAQHPDLRGEVVVGSEAERYLRVLQVAGRAPLYPWTLRGFSPAEVDRLVPDSAAHPWSARLAPRADSAGANGFHLLRPQADAVFNSAFPQGDNDGAVWAGRGVTAALRAGFAARYGALSVRVEPVAYWAQNRAFDLMPHAAADSAAFNDPDNPDAIDLPQRFGDGAFAQVDPGQSTVRLDAAGFAVGVSTANQQWGPASDMPLLLGANGPGMPHVFLGTASPWRVGIGRVYARLVWATLAQSEYAPMSGHGSRRYGSGASIVFLPWGLDGLEVGVGRFFHEAWPQGGLEAGDLLRPVESFFKGSLGGRDEPGGPQGGENQIASAFFRWVLPRGGAELYGEFAREDHSWHLRDFLLEPDRSSGYLLGGRKTWARGRSLLSLRAELLDTQPGHLHLASHQGRFYRHGSARQGHTLRGQLLGSPAAYGGGGSVVAFDAYTPRGRWSVDWTRARVRGGLTPAAVAADSGMVDVRHSLGGEALFFRGGWDLLVRVRGTMELNRYLRKDENELNLSAALGVRFGF